VIVVTRVISDHREVAGRTPVLVGVGLEGQRIAEPFDADEPLTLMRRATAAAAQDSGKPEVLTEVDRVYVPKGRWHYRDPGRAIATSFGAAKVTSVLARVGVLQESLLADACTKIVDGAAEVCLITGGEAAFRLLCATKRGLELDDEQQETEPDEAWRADSSIMLPEEIAAGLGQDAVGAYAIIATAARAARGQSVNDDLSDTAALYSGLSEIAARNSYAWKRSPITADAVTSNAPDNPVIAFPYRNEHVSRWSVDQASALLLTSADKARQLGIDPSRWIYPVSSALSNAMLPLTRRKNLGEAPGARQAASAALDHAEMTAQALDLLELYSCFPIAIQAHAAALGLASDAPIPSFMGGMRYAGGPFNNFVLHATAQLALVLRDTDRTGLISSVSGVLTKQAFSVWSALPAHNQFRSFDVSNNFVSQCPPKELVENYIGTASIVGYTVLAPRKNRPGEARAIAITETADGRRMILSSDSSSLAEAMMTEEFCGRRVVGDGTFDFASHSIAMEAS
jgi:acetyl-CoA C-acetyltransferase